VTAEVLAVHDAWFGLLPPPLGEFSPFRKLLLEVPAFAAALSNRSLEYEHRPGRTLSPTATQAYARLRWTGESVDLSLIGGTLLDLLGVPTIPEPAAFEREPVALPVHHPRYAMIGHAGTTTLGAFIVRWELALELQRPFAMRDDSLVLPAWQSLRENSAAELAGVTFVPSTHTSAAIEVTARQWLRRGPKLETLRLLYPLLEPRFALRFHHQFWSDRASFDVLALIFGASPLNAWAARAELGYALADGIEVSIGYVTYQPSDHFGFLHGFEAHDRAYLNLRCAFSSD
jgi:hypothetical protein